MFYITPLEASCITVLGHNWLTRYNPLIDWVLASIKFHSLLQTDSLMSPETVAMALLSSNLPSPLTPTLFVALKVSFVNAAAFTHLSKMDKTQVYQLYFLTRLPLTTLQLTWLAFQQTTLNSPTSSVKPTPLLLLHISLMISRLDLRKEPLLHLVWYIPFLRVSWSPSGSF